MLSIIDEARAIAGKDAAKRLAAEMQPSIQWLQSYEPSVRNVEIHIPLEGQMPPKYAKVHRPIVERLMAFHRGSDIVKALLDPLCEARPSKIHGMGVFATHDIPAYSYLTMYPCDGVRWQPKEWLDIPQLAGSMYGTGWSGESTVETIAYSQCLPAPPKTGNLAIIGNPKLCGDAHFLAHLINDGAMCKRPEAASAYLITSEFKANSVYDPVLMAQFSIKDIKAGEEVLNSYGVAYWLDLIKYKE